MPHYIDKICHTGNRAYEYIPSINIFVQKGFEQYFGNNIINIFILLQNSKEKQAQAERQSLPNHNVAHIKLVVTFCAYGVSAVLNYTAYSYVLTREDAYSKALHQYFECESTGVNSNKTCDRRIFENLDPTEFTFPATTIFYMLFPLATLLYVTDIKKLMKCKRLKKKATVQVLK